MRALVTRAPATLRLPLLVVVVVMGASLVGCPALTGGSGSRPEGFRLVEGELELPQTGIVGRQVTGLQMAAVSVRDVDGTKVPDVYVSDIFNPAQRTSASEFVVPVDGTKAFHLILQVPGGGQGPGQFLGRLMFDDGNGGTTSLIPAGATDIALGPVAAIENAPETAADNVLRVDTGHHPLAQVDSDLDTTSDLLDDDDDDDGNPDNNDEDVAGDGIADVDQGWAALGDEDADGIPDAFDADG